MGTLKIENRTAEYQWATDVNFDGIRLEVLSIDGNTLFDISIPDYGHVTVNTFGKEVAADLIDAAVKIAR
ncbi:MAG: hypothetical protein KKC72_12270 [Alphaproteobacteria bacterium]|nr:hypothetical protein [Alphaproteobacteria bacterium]MBU1834648.1 hypothetical protein [Alphaproteobacteria bacterium]|tara:strand:+ start:123 stop:332 length:210 start_codon:yes stop_codon:yes gene_type:complete